MTDITTPEAGGLEEQAPKLDPEVTVRRDLVVALRACKPKQRKWLRRILANGGFTYKAGDDLGISRSTVRNWLRNPVAMRAVRLTQDLLAYEEEVGQARILREYKRIAFSDVRQAFNELGVKNPTSWDDDTAAAIAEYSFDRSGLPTVRVHDKRGALDALARIQKLGVTSRVELTGPDGKPLSGVQPVIQVVRYEDAKADGGTDPRPAD